jgi:hypothetical protein
MAAANSLYDSALQATAGVFDDVFGKEAVYLPAAGGSRTIKGFLTVLGPGKLPGFRFGTTERFLFSTPNSATAGISAVELNTGGDKIRVENPKTGTVQDWRINGIEKIDAGRLLLQIG